MPRYNRAEYTTRDIHTAAAMDQLGIPFVRCDLEPDARGFGRPRAVWVFDNADDRAFEAATDLHHSASIVLPFLGLRDSHKWMAKQADQARKQHQLGSSNGSLTNDQHHD